MRFSRNGDNFDITTEGSPAQTFTLDQLKDLRKNTASDLARMQAAEEGEFSDELKALSAASLAEYDTFFAQEGIEAL